jgi:miniconductance mechanosensitive channel
MKGFLDFSDFLRQMGLTFRQVEVWNGIIVAVIIILVSVLAFYITRFIISRIVIELIAKSKNDYDDFFVKNRVFEPVAHIVPAIILFWGIRYVTTDANLLIFLRDAIFSYLIVVVSIVIFRFLDALNDIYEVYAQKKDLTIHIKQYLQVLKILIAITALILIFALVLNKRPGALLAGLGAMTAVLLLIFKDSILSLVASIQISAYNLVRVGDWITIPSKGVDGDIMDISLNTIKIRNFDKTISTVPTYQLVQDTFINWRGMVQTGGRRIKRAINIDVNSIRLCNTEMIERFKKIRLISDYVSKTQAEIDKWNKENNIEEPLELNGRAQTNLGVFRKYLENYIRSRFRSFKKYSKEKFVIDGIVNEFFVIDDFDELKKELPEGLERFVEIIEQKYVIRNLEKFLIFYEENFVLENDYLYRVKKITENRIVRGVRIQTSRFEKIIEKEGDFADDLTLLVRQLSPTEKGVPVEIYAFASTTNWNEYEKIQSDLFDHIFAVLSNFDLRVYQEPSSSDFANFLEYKKVSV